jgi:hypothetical protein
MSERPNFQLLSGSSMRSRKRLRSSRSLSERPCELAVGREPRQHEEEGDDHRRHQNFLGVQGRSPTRKGPTHRVQ